MSEAMKSPFEQKIENYERQGLFDKDIAEDPPTIPLQPGKVDYTCRKLSTRIGAKLANCIGSAHFERKMKKGEVILKEIRGRESLDAIKATGALVVCNHFDPFDNYAVYKAIKPALEGRDLYKVIREGNYTNFRGLYGYLFRHCNTLPLSSSLACMKEFLAALHLLFARGEKVLIYPEQALWPHYRKPRPLKVGSFRLAAKENVPVLPLFITMEDTEKKNADGGAVQAYTVHILPVLHPEPDKKVRENSELLCRRTYALWKETYEQVYGIPLTYLTEGEVDPCSYT